MLRFFVRNNFFLKCGDKFCVCGAQFGCFGGHLHGFVYHVKMGVFGVFELVYENDGFLVFLRFFEIFDGF